MGKPGTRTVELSLQESVSSTTSFPAGMGTSFAWEGKQQQLDPLITALIEKECKKHMAGLEAKLTAGAMLWEDAVDGEELTTANGHGKPEEKDQEEEEEEDIGFEGSADAADLTNFYSFALTNLQEVLAKDGALNLKHALRVLAMVFSVLALVVTQLVLAYGFYDAAIVLKVQGTLDSFRDPLPFSFWYAHSIVEETAVSNLNCIASFVAIVLLGIYLKNDNEGTLITICPMELLCVPRAGGHAPHVFGGGMLSVLWRLPIVLTAQACWCIRALLVPVLAGYGTVGAMLNSQNGQDIVLNSVAIGFVLELDEFIYDNLLGKQVKTRYEEKTLPPTAALATPNGSAIATIYANVIYLTDLIFLLYAFFEEIYKPAHLIIETMVEVDIARRYDRLRTCIMVRASLLALAQAHLALDGARARKRTKTQLLLPLAVMMVLIVGTVAFMYTFVLAGLLDGNLGCSFPNVMLSLKTMACCVPDENLPFAMTAEARGFSMDDCGKLDEKQGMWDSTPVSIFEEIYRAADQADANEYDDPMALAWGKYPPHGYYMGHLVVNVLQMKELWGFMRGFIPSIAWEGGGPPVQMPMPPPDA